VDLYTLESRRIRAGLELHAGFLLGTAAQKPCGGVGSPIIPFWEIAYNEYVNRAGLALPNTNQVIMKIRPTGTDHHIDWETLTHAQVGDVGLP
jgi:hypothetical protein